MADVQYTTLYLPDGTGVSVVVGSQLQAAYLASGATTSPRTYTASTSTSPAAPDVRTPVATVWFHTPFGPQPITAPDIIDEYRRRDYAEMTASQAAAFYASGAEIPDVSYVTGIELPAAMAAVAVGNNAFATAQRAASVAAVTDAGFATQQQATGRAIAMALIFGR
ncbi:MAG: hypothetical protein JWM31_3445 [Solirubrobacterales bacterium]|nr:hypothetical protein [Solirubrobacterales bacterium]